MGFSSPWRGSGGTASSVNVCLSSVILQDWLPEQDFCAALGLARAIQQFSTEFFITVVGASDQLAANLDRFVFNEALQRQSVL